MIVFDTDHLTVLMYPESPQHGLLTSRMANSDDPDFATTIVNAEEQLRGWLAKISGQRTPHEQIPPYDRLRKMLNFLRPFSLISLDENSADEFERLRKATVRIGSMDLKIGCITLVHNALLLSANLRDFQHVPGLRVENWLKE